MLTKRTYIVPVLIAAAIALPASLAIADGSAPTRIGVADAKPVSIAVLAPSVARFHHELRAGAHRVRTERRTALRRQRREAFASTGVSMATLESIASCESGGDPTAVSSDGSYRGKYQFDYGTWESVGGSGDPAAAPEAEQDYRAALLYARSGSSPWPVCGS